MPPKLRDLEESGPAIAVVRQTTKPVNMSKAAERAAPRRANVAKSLDRLAYCSESRIAAMTAPWRTAKKDARGNLRPVARAMVAILHRHFAKVDLGQRIPGSAGLCLGGSKKIRVPQWRIGL